MGLTSKQYDLLAEAIERGYSRSQIAKYAGVCERTAVAYRKIGEGEGFAIPKHCGCGRLLGNYIFNSLDKSKGVIYN
jgi:hypothetical protein